MRTTGLSSLGGPIFPDIEEFDSSLRGIAMTTLAPFRGAHELAIVNMMVLIETNIACAQMGYLHPRVQSKGDLGFLRLVNNQAKQAEYPSLA
ncbi:hypothetical protein AA0121_g1627 [Alternaria tenuissima]|jgi:hypothetical protein|nr:hypothetical protein AA0121_g1627 [Alternaria tenuissima]